MSGFALANNEEVLSAFAPEQLPIMMTLAKEFAVFNRFYAAVPGPSQPNHMFAQSGTSCGVTETGVTYWQCGGLLPLFPQVFISASRAFPLSFLSLSLISLYLYLAIPLSFCVCMCFSLFLEDDLRLAPQGREIVRHLLQRYTRGYLYHVSPG